MKRLYFVLGLILLIGSLGAGAKSVKFTTDNVAATYLGIALEYGQIGIPWEEDGTASVTIGDDQGINVSVNTGYYISKITVNGEEVGSMILSGFYLAPEMLPDIATVDIRAVEKPKSTVRIIGDPSVIDVKYMYHTYEPSSWQGNMLAINIVDTFQNVYIYTRDGYALKSIINDGIDLIGDNYKDYTIVCSDLKAGDNDYIVETISIAESRTSTFTVDVEGDASKVIVRRAGDTDTEFTGKRLSEPIPFSPLFDLPIVIENVIYGREFYKVISEGEEIPFFHDKYSVGNIKDGGTIKVMTAYPDIDIPIRITFTNPGTETSVKSVSNTQFENFPMSEWLAPDFSVPMGSTVHIELNSKSYNISATVNGVAANNEYIDITALDEEGYDIVVTAEDKAPFLVTFYYAGLPAHFKVYIGMDGNDFVEMTGEYSTVVSVPCQRNYVRLVADEGWEISDVYMGDEIMMPEFAINSDVSVDVFVKEDTSSGLISVEEVESADVFSLQGIRVSRDVTPEQLRNLPAGIYIIAGRKVRVN